MIAFLCSGCGKSLKVKDELAGKRGKCPHCLQAMRVPTSAEAADKEGYSSDEARTILPPGTDTERDMQTIAPVAPVAPETGHKRKKSRHRDGDSSSGTKKHRKRKKTSLSEGIVSKRSPSQLIAFLAPASEPDEIGRLGEYRVLKVLGAGGMGVVYQAEDPKLKRLVALKAMLPVLAASEVNRTRFLREAQTAANVDHDHIVHIYQVSEDRGVPFIAMQFLKGETLEDRLKREMKASAEEILRIGRETAEGLAAAHKHGLIHRDIKPANIWLEGDRRRVKILDFGLARSSGEAHLTQHGMVMGTPAFMAPEQAGGKEVDARCDLFSLGCVLYRMATGRVPFRGNDTLATLMAIATKTPKAPHLLNPELPPAVSQLIMDLLAKDPEDRPASADAVIAAIEELEKTPQQTPAPVAPVPAPLPEPPVRTRIVAEEEPRRTIETFRLAPAPRETQRMRAGSKASRSRSSSSVGPYLIAGLCGLFVLLAVGLVAAAVAMKSGKGFDFFRRPFANANNPNQEPGTNSGTTPNPAGGTEQPAPDAGSRVQPIKARPAIEGRSLKAYSRRFGELVFAPNGKHFASFASNSNSVDYWDVATTQVLRRFDLGVGVEHVTFSPDGAQVIAFGASRLAVWDVKTAQAAALPLVAPPLHRIVGVGFTDDKDIRAVLAVRGNVLVPGAPAGDVLIFFDLRKNKHWPPAFPHPAGVRQVFFNPTATHAVTMGTDHTLRSWDLVTNQALTAFPPMSRPSRTLAMAADGKRLLGSFYEANVKVFDVEFGTLLKDLAVQPFGDTDAVAFGLDSKSGVAGGFPGIVRLLDLDSGEIKKEFKAGTPVVAVALSPDGGTVLAGDVMGTLHIFKGEN